MNTTNNKNHTTLNAKLDTKQLTPIKQHNFKRITKGCTTALTTIAIGLTGTMAMSQAQAKDISPSTAYYNFSIKDKISGNGKATRILKKSGNSWSYSSNASALRGAAKATQKANFTINSSKVKPSSAKTSYKALGVGNTHKISFGNSSAVSTYKNKSKTLSMPKQAYDDLTLEVQIRQELLNNSFTGNYYMVKKNSIVQTRFKKSGTVTITTPAGTFKTIRVDRVHSNSDKQTTFWLAPSLDYLPVKVVQKDSKTNMTLKLTGKK